MDVGNIAADRTRSQTPSHFLIRSEARRLWKSACICEKVSAYLL